MKNVILLFITCLFLVGCSKANENVVVINETVSETTMEVTSETITEVRQPQRIAQGRYYTNGTVITNDGNEWGYHTSKISGKEPYDGIPIIAVFDCATEIEDDSIKGILLDRETEIYDALEREMSQNEDWDITRKGNEIRISVKVKGE